MEFIVGTDEYMFVTPTETTGLLSDTFENLGVTATYSIYPDDETLSDSDAIVLNQAVQDLKDNTFFCRIAPDNTDPWSQGQYALYLKITNIPGYAEKPRFGPFRFGVIQ